MNDISCYVQAIAVGCYMAIKARELPLSWPLDLLRSEII